MRRIVVLAALLAVAGCKKRAPDAALERIAETRDAPATPSGALSPVRDAETLTMLAIYYLPEPSTPPRPVFDALRAALPELTLGEDGPRPAVFYEEQSPPGFLLDADSLPYMSRGLDDRQRAAVTASKLVVLLGFVGRGDHAVVDLRRAQALAGELAARTGGLVWVDEARMLYGREAWQRRVTAAATDPPDLSGLFTAHLYEVERGGVRVVTLGLGQLGLPELAIDDVPRTRSDAANVLVNAVAQLLAEGHVPAADGRFEVDLSAVRNPAAAAALRPHDGVTRKVAVRLVPAEPQEGDNPTRLWRIDFLGDGSYTERLVAATTTLFGITDEVIKARGDDRELLAARDRARTRLPEVAARFARGLPMGDRLSVKAPIGPPDRREWVWVEVQRWSAGRIRGVLMSQPYQDVGLREGSEVEVDEAEVFDWTIQHADGSVEGGETDEILLRRGR